ncbi:MAG: ergothioneine biosynthesis protein EgtB [Pseudomonadota bacterium]
MNRVSTLKPVAQFDALANRYAVVRNTTAQLVAPLEPEDTVVQSMPDVSPSKWHLAHVTWFFEHFVLAHFDPDYERYNPRYDFLFNSYYYSVGDMHARPQRGLLTRPTLAEILEYRERVDDAVLTLLDRRPDEPELVKRIALGLHHEQQHQELFLTDIKHVLAQNPLKPAYDPALPAAPESAARQLEFAPGPDGLEKVGNSADGYGFDSFCFDNETPRHETLLRPHRLATRLVNNAEYREFIRDGGYADTRLWLSDGWSTLNKRGWTKPLYWQEDLEREFTLGGIRPLDPAAPVSHLSYYEADAFARWAGARLPTEFEWEAAANSLSMEGNLFESGYLHPVSGSGAQYFGDVWEWTASPYAPYPGFKPLAGSLGEYNGKFMCNQMTVRGGSAVTSQSHIRASYRSFFYPEQRWQMLGLRLAKD